MPPYYLAHVGAQAGNSPSPDAGTGAVEDYRLSSTATCTAGRADGDDDGDGGTGPIDMGYHYLGAYEGSGDTYIELVSFAAGKASSIVLTWETGAEIDNAGFVIFRAIKGARNHQQISDLIPAQGTPASGASYTFIDNKAMPHVTYEYWLTDINTGGNWSLTALSGPNYRLPNSGPLRCHPHVLLYRPRREVRG